MKTALQRLDDTLDAMESWENHPASVFGGTSGPIRTQLEARLSDPGIEEEEIGAEISLGDRGLIRRSSVTNLRKLKRILLLIHRLMCYNSRAETFVFKARVQRMNEAETIREVKAWLGLGIQFYIARRGGDVRQFLNLTLPKNGGRLVHCYSQGGQGANLPTWRDSRIHGHDFTSKGWCLGVSTHWLGYQTRPQQDFWAFLRTDIGAAEMQGSYRRNKLAEVLDDPSFGDKTNLLHKQIRQQQWAEDRLSDYGLRLRQKLSSISIPNAEQLANSICFHDPAFCVVEISLSAGGHAMAARRSGTDIIFMDPNAGEVRFGSKEGFREWLPKLFRFLGYDMIDFTVYHYVEDPSVMRRGHRLDAPQRQDAEPEFVRVRNRIIG